MALILNIDTSTPNASVCLAEKEERLGMLSNAEQKHHATWLHVAIQELLLEAGKNLRDLEAIGITAGPGSFTGLRVGMAAAKGLCYALKIPLIPVNTLEAMASAAIDENTDYICPMIDARRMEVYTALYTKELVPVISPCAMILDANSFFEILTTKRILFLGNGGSKFEGIARLPNAIFKDISFSACHLSILTFRSLDKADFKDLAYIELVYLKDYYPL